MKTGKLIVITGPSGVGKGTLIEPLLARHPSLHLSVSATTRQPRQGEVNGKNYFFVTIKEFENLIATDSLLEWAEYAGNYYGTPRQAVEEKIALGITVILEIELIGARAIKKNFPEVFRIFILPPSVTELEKRLRGRGKDDDSVIVKRLEIAKQEIAASNEFDRQIINDDLETALAKIEAAIFLPEETTVSLKTVKIVENKR